MALWRKATFKGGKVWAMVDSHGALAAVSGRVPVRYSEREGAKVYRAGAARVTVLEGSTPQELPEGTDADAAKRTKRPKGSGFGKAGTRTKAQQEAARQDALARLASLPEGTSVAYTDGGCKGNPGPAGSGVRLELSDGRVVEMSRSLGRATNNVAELTAIAMALQLLDEAEMPAEAPVVVLSDSSYARGVLTQGWKAKKNVELIGGLREQLAARPGVTLEWVAGHSGIPGNERADALATDGVAGRTAVDWS